MSSRLVMLGHLSFRRRGLLFPIAFVLLLIPGPEITHHAAALAVAGFLIALMGELIRVGTIGLAYIIRGGKDHHVYAESLVTEGLYGHCRNPMYLGNLLLLIGLALASNSWVFVLLGVPIALAVHATMIAAEESFLRDKFGSVFDEYCARVPRLFPRLQGLSSMYQSMQFDWRRVLVKEFSKPVDWLSATALIVILSLWRAGELAAQAGLVNVMLVFIAARLAVWVAARSEQQRHHDETSIP